MAYNKLSTANLPDPVIDPAQGSSPEDYFNTVLYTGTGSTGNQVTSGFATDFIWLKDRGDADVHQLIDIVRGGNKLLQSNQTDAEYTLTSASFNSTGVELLTGSGNINGSGDSFVSWNWKANGSGVSNTDGSITSTVSANTESGFSIVTYTGNGSANQSVGHGLSQTPELVIFKNRSSAANWGVTGSLLGLDKRLYLNTTDFSETNTGYHPLDTATVINVSGVNNWGNSNASGANFVAYAFHSVEGFSKFGSYTGNGSSDGPFVYTGFRPAFVMVKRTNSTGNWQIYDTARDSFNYAGLSLAPNGSAAESDGGEDLDILSNGFKARDTAGARNANGGSYIYMAFAENPFKYSNAR